MGWSVEPFGSCHEGITGAVLADGSEPKPVYLDCGSGAGTGWWTSEWWAYTGHGSRPRAAACRAACACGWRGQPYPIDWDTIDEDQLEDLDTSRAYGDWRAHIDTVERQTVPLPEELAETLTRLDEQLYRLAGQAPLAVLKAVTTLEGLVRDVAHQAAHAVEADGLSPETIGTALSSPDKASSRMTGYLYHR
ncbi:MULTISPECIES: hypothetical protein [Streptomyces]|uniref:hypothetical protein n=1 Tax=Streptomyces TaxID=1883 RepID=UPI0007CD6D1A|nr:hypothetical protein A4V12_31910 [Streptomyces noursei]